MEAAANATTIVFDKTGTLTEARPTVRKVVSFCEQSEDELLRMAACLEEHFPHSMQRLLWKPPEKEGWSMKRCTARSIILLHMEFPPRSKENAW